MALAAQTSASAKIDAVAPAVVTAAKTTVANASVTSSAKAEAQSDSSNLRLAAFAILGIALLIGLGEVARRLTHRRTGHPRGARRSAGDEAARRRRTRAAITVLACGSGAFFAYLIVNPSIIGG